MLIRSEPKKFWKIVNNRRSTGGIPRLVKHNNKVATNMNSAVELFAEHFESVYTDTPAPPPQYGPALNGPDQVTISTADIAKGLAELDVTKGVGPDLIPNLALKALSNELVTPLSIIFNLSLQSGVFPAYWKHSFVVPIFKSGNRSLCSNYRGICLLSALPKMFEKIVCSQMESSLGGLINPAQHGFRSGRSTTTNLLLFVDYVLNGMGHCGQVDALYTDFSKAFDKVNHQLLIQKLQLLGVSGALLSWLQSYLTARTQSIKIGATLSRPIQSCSGVPQGSHLGPLLFALFINDLCDDLEDCDFLLFADDLKIFKKISSPSDAASLDVNLQRIWSWCERNAMSLNVDKCVAITFSRRSVNNRILWQYSIGNQILKRTEVIKDLGVLLDTGMTFKQHINQVVARGKCMLGFIKRQAKDFDCPFVSRSLYCSLVRPLLEYCSVIWDPIYDVDRERVESIQRQYLLFALRHLNWQHRFILPPYEARLTLLNLNTLCERRKLASCLLTFSCLNGAIRSIEVSSLFNFAVTPRSLRSCSGGPRLILPPLARAVYVENAPSRRCIKQFNQYAMMYSPGESALTFKRKVLSTFMEERRGRLGGRSY